MNIQIVTQPFADDIGLLDVLRSVLATANKLTIAVAWAKRSGLMLIQDDLVRFRAKGGTGALIVGIDEGGATRQGLEQALVLFDTVYVLHDRTGRTFHPKIYLVEGDERAHLFVGSNNITRGGMGFNYEVGVLMELDGSLDRDRTVWTKATAYIHRLVQDSSVCIELTADTLSTLVADPKYEIQDEERPRKHTLARQVDLDTSLDVGRDPLFGVSSVKKKSVPRMWASARSGGVGIPAGTASRRTRPPRPAAASPVIRRWTKQLSAFDAQQPPRSGTKRTGNLRLAKAGHPIDHRIYFRQVFFATQRWTEETGGLEAAWVPFQIIIGGRDLGLMSLKVDYAPRREAAQHNVTTVLHWGEQLGAELKSGDFSGSYLALEQLQDGSYRLVLSSTNPGPFIQ